jgi:formate dehydrogenase major subunit
VFKVPNFQKLGPWALASAVRNHPGRDEAPTHPHYDQNMKPVWPVWKQITSRDLTALGATAASERSANLTPRTRSADKVVKSICPYCAVGCGQDVHVRDGRIIDIEGDADSPISRGCLCPKGSATFQLVTGAHRLHHVLYRRPHSSQWEIIPLDRAMDMVAARVRDARESTWDAANRRTMGIAHLGGATLDNEENYLIKKLFTALGIVQIENQARI